MSTPNSYLKISRMFDNMDIYLSYYQNHNEKNTVQLENKGCTAFFRSYKLLLFRCREAIEKLYLSVKKVY